MTLWSCQEDPHCFYAYGKNGRKTTALANVLPQMIGKAQPRALGHLIWKGWVGHQGPQRHTSFLPTKSPLKDDKYMRFGAGISTPEASLLYSHTMTTGPWSSLVWSRGDRILPLLPTAHILQKVYLNVRYITAYTKIHVRTKKLWHKWRFPFFRKM